MGQNPFGYSNYQLGGAISNQGAQYLDGVPLNNSYVNELSLIPTQDALEEFKVQTNNLDAEWGRFAGGVVNFTTKSGTNDIHGAAYEYLRNTVLNANQFFLNASGIPRAPFVQNQFGGDAGGPFYIPHLYDGRNKTFWFASYEGFRLRQGQSYVESVPSVAERGGDFTNYRDGNGNVIPIYNPLTTVASEVGGSTPSRQQLNCNGTLNTICPSMINPTSLVMLNQFPLPNTAGSQYTNFNNFVSAASQGGDTNAFTLKVDQNISDKQHFFFRYALWKDLNLPIEPFGSAPVQQGVCQDRCTETFTTNNFVGDDVYNFSPTTIMDIRVSYGRLDYDRTPSTVGINLAAFGPGFAALQNQVYQANLPIPDLNSGPDSALKNVFDTQGTGSVIFARENTYRVAGSLTKIKGRHTFQFGGEYRVDQHNYAQTNTPVGLFAFSSAFTAADPINQNGTGSAMASFLLGYGSTGQSPASTPALIASQTIYPALYAQDQFKVNNKLTLNLGVRWEQTGPFSERFNRISYLQPNLSTSVAGLSQVPCSVLPAATAAALGQSQICFPNLQGNLGLVASPQRPERYGQNKPWAQFSPHLGFAYQLNPLTVIRGGYGLFWISNVVEDDEAPNTDGLNSIGTPWKTSVDGGNTPCINPGPTGCPGAGLAQTFNLSNPFPNGILQPPGRNISAYQESQWGGGPFALQPSNPYAYYQQWNIDIQRQLPHGGLIDLAYAGAKGTHLPDFSQQINPLPDQYLSLGSHLHDLVPNPFQGLFTNGNSLSTASTVQLQQLLLPYPQYTGYSIGAAGWGSSSYNSLQAKYEQRLKGGQAILVSYTNSKMITMGDIDSLTSWLETTGAAGIQDWNNRKNERSLSSYDVPQRFVLSYVLQLPVGPGKKWASGTTGAAGKLIGGWGIQGITTYQRGFPLNFGFPSGGTSAQNDGMRPNKLATAALNGSAESRLGEWFNTSDFTVPAPFTYGNESRVDPVLRSQGIQNWDFAIVKDTNFGPENKLNMQFRTEFFNLTNKPQFGPPNTTTSCAAGTGAVYSPCSGTGNFGVVNSTINNPRLIQFALRFTF